MSQQYDKANIYTLVYWHIRNVVSDPDLLFHMIEVFWPTFTEKDGRVFLKEQFSKDYYNRLIDEDSNSEYWINLFKLDDFFSEMDDWDEKASLFAQALVPIWEVKLQRDFPEMKFTVRYLCDEEVGDYGLTFYQAKDGLH